jgi:hypothetical protein
MIRLKETGLSNPCMAVRGRWRRVCGGSLVVAGFFAVPADVQGLPDLQRELREMRQHYDAELKRLRRDYETRIERLEKQVKAAEGPCSSQGLRPGRRRHHRARPARPPHPLQAPLSSNRRGPSCRHRPFPRWAAQPRKRARSTRRSGWS